MCFRLLTSAFVTVLINNIKNNPGPAVFISLCRVFASEAGSEIHTTYICQDDWKTINSQWRPTPLIPAVRRQRQVELCEFQDGLQSHTEKLCLQKPENKTKQNTVNSRLSFKDKLDACFWKHSLICGCSGSSNRSARPGELVPPLALQGRVWLSAAAAAVAPDPCR